MAVRGKEWPEVAELCQELTRMLEREGRILANLTDRELDDLMRRAEANLLGKGVRAGATGIARRLPRTGTTNLGNQPGSRWS